MKEISNINFFYRVADKDIKERGLFLPKEDQKYVYKEEEVVPTERQGCFDPVPMVYITAEADDLEQEETKVSLRPGVNQKC